MCDMEQGITWDTCTPPPFFLPYPLYNRFMTLFTFPLQPQSVVDIRFNLEWKMKDYIELYKVWDTFSVIFF